MVHRTRNAFSLCACIELVSNVREWGDGSSLKPQSAGSSSSRPGPLLLSAFIETCVWPFLLVRPLRDEHTAAAVDEWEAKFLS